jgi:uncharacterized membrane protein YhaH (DUF805 family)
MNYYLSVLKNYAVFNGRARRSEFWYFVLFNIAISMVLNFVGGAISFPLLGSLYSLAILIPALAVGVRRMHDVGKSGWFLLIPIYSLILACTPGKEGENSYGRDPKGAAALAETV